ncbi:peptidyl-prolyl cis-trans isomerase D [Allochromatium warmingii]|uniref:Periplasmic chaperone PpiD n=1 Tax=Allochromatium warmingii TaxID=61595 RepID=A0A1H3B2H0_ALLWA|nr:SurA N-terminal domain-containing protein [Allochromatium warmingii]SDX36005.1 peptidyl-prolyl cis-trans isomerase D [Allochromatium warmingii]
MLQTIRERAQGWIAWAIVILISIPFALWGIQSYLGVGGEPIAATVNGVELPERELDRRVQEARLDLRERLGADYDPATVDDQQLRAEVLDTLIQETVLLEAVKRLGLRVSDQEVQLQILSDPSFVKDGRFDKETYERLLRFQGLTPALYEAQLRQKLSATQLVRALASSELATRTERDAYKRLMGQRREISYLRLPLAAHRTEEPLDEARITAYYDSNRARFQTPEQVKLDYLVLDSEQLAAKIEVSEDELRQLYASDQARFVQPERRAVRHLLLKVEDGADAAAAQAVLEQIQAIRARIQAGESFEELAKTLSQDPGSAAQGGSLGIIESGIMVPAFDQAAFALAVGAVSEPVRTNFGYHLIEVTQIQPATTQPFAAVRESLHDQLTKQRAESLFYDLAERLATITYESPESLEPAAQELGLTIQHSDWVSREHSEPSVLAHPKVMAAAFHEEVLVNGRNSDLLEPERDRLQAVVLRVVAHRDVSVKALADVREEISAAIRDEQARVAAKAAAEALAEKLRDGSDWSAAGADLTPELPGLVDRQSTAVPAGVLDAAFKLAVPTEGGVSIGTAILDDGDAVVVRVTKVEDGQIDAETADAGFSAEAFIITQMLGRQAYLNALADMQSRAKIERKVTATAEAMP